MKTFCFTPRRALGLSFTTALVGILSCWALAAEAGDLTRSTGLTQPVLADFPLNYAQIGSVHDDALVLQAQLRWTCAAAPPVQAVDSVPAAPPTRPLPPYVSHGHPRLHAGFSSGGAGRHGLACPTVGSLYPRSPLETDVLMKQFGARADDLCRRQSRGPRPPHGPRRQTTQGARVRRRPARSRPVQPARSAKRRPTAARAQTLRTRHLRRQPAPASPCLAARRSRTTPATSPS